MKRKIAVFGVGTAALMGILGINVYNVHSEERPSVDPWDGIVSSEVEESIVRDYTRAWGGEDTASFRRTENYVRYYDLCRRAAGDESIARKVMILTVLDQASNRPSSNRRGEHTIALIALLRQPTRKIAEAPPSPKAKQPRESAGSPEYLPPLP